MACLLNRASTVKVAAQLTTPAPAPVVSVSRRSVLGAVMVPLAASLLSVSAAEAAANKNLSRTELLQQQRTERKEAMKAKNAKVRTGEVKPSF
ncbi:hypothetical protein PLESTB_000460700 [Pleodorina starrii]|uniref:Uncharacterized protein n=1 Tax=Pleodorina starrii TaxID=330485 RepID=A0A9W6BGH5_9CHLO|nr:hypothetical protein PLESTM_000795100 [Pleodorina starrii]GLC51051.1 hypothetical protein PLESTB_000460700 [Pleodorina starrii]GLC63412.1 hypothetical protein PLESTF_000033500 [Pleodorina starrii]